MARPDGVHPSLRGWYEDAYAFDGERRRLAHRRVFVAEPRAGKTGRVGEYFAAFFDACESYRRPRGS